MNGGALTGKVCLVTGSTRGIGRAVAERFVAEGAAVAINGRKETDCKAVSEELGERAVPVAGDVADPVEVARMVDQTLETFGRLDVLVNNAGIARDNFVTRTSDDDWAAVLGVNLSGAFYAVRSVVPAMKEQGGGSIINVVSWAGLRGNVGQVAYSASKAGLLGLTLACAKELAKFQIRVNALAPMVPTEMTDQMTEAIYEKALKRVPLHRFGTAAEVAEAALFLASDRSSYTTGQVLNVDGGVHLT